MVTGFKIKYMFAGEHVHCHLIAVRGGINATLGKLRVHRTDFGYMQLAMRGVAFEEDDPQVGAALKKPKHGPTVMPAPKLRLATAMSEEEKLALDAVDRMAADFARKP